MELGIPGHKDVAWFGVFDGHGGDLVSIESYVGLLWLCLLVCKQNKPWHW